MLSVENIVLYRTQEECSVACLKNGSSLFQFDETTENCSFGNATANVLEASPGNTFLLYKNS